MSRMGSNLVARGQTQAQEVWPMRNEDGSSLVPVQPPPDPEERLVPRRDVIRRHAADLFGEGMTVPKVAKILQKRVRPDLEHDKVKQYKRTYRLIRRWTKETAFRDMVYSKAVVDVDMATPQILKGIVGSAKKGRVDAARLALELTGRHVKDDSMVPNVTVQIANIPRPDRVEDPVPHAPRVNGPNGERIMPKAQPSLDE